uniref:MRH domain-containing protein n=1 Tax=Ascaris lumbricoides TaxID=6252 RepID=A0A9J2P5S7_ASCLU
MKQASAAQCTADDFIYEYTTCDERGERWRVAVPKHEDLRCDGGSPLPTRGTNCSFSCQSGMFLDIDTQQCVHCAKGSYSLGGGTRFDEFTQLPTGFVVENIDVSVDRMLTNQKATECPAETGWIVKNSELMYVPTPCLSKLTYSATLVRPGYVEYTYRMPRNSRGLVFNVVVKNEQCQSYRDQLKQLMSGTTKERPSHRSEEDGEWQRRRIELRTGPNVITWSVANNRDAISTADVITLSKIDIVGIPFARQCTLCPAGTYSGKGAKECAPCPAGYFSTKGSSQCGKCPLSQFSGPRAARCIDRPKCTENDYYPTIEPCIDGKTRTVYKKVQPNICRDDIPGSVKVGLRTMKMYSEMALRKLNEMPKPEAERSCPKCNPGMSFDSNGQCVFCQRDHFSDGDECKRCPVDTIPNYGFQYILWNNLPPNMATRCEYLTEDSTMSCNIGESWLPAGNLVHSSPTHELGIALELLLYVREGFSNPLLPKGTKASAQNPTAHITFEFEISCADSSCVLYFIEDSSSQSFYKLIADFNGTQSRRSYTHAIISPQPTKFLFAFMRSRSSSQDDVITDRASIYSINVTNVGQRGGGASACLPCPTSNGKCVACPPGRYISESGRECRKCPRSTMLNTSSDRVGEKSCIPCGPNLDSDDGVSCSSNGILSIRSSDNKTSTFNFTNFLNRTFVATGVKVFAREGTSYFHSFNISLLTEGGATCTETYDVSDFGQAASLVAEARESVESFVCRSTALPVRASSNISEKLVYVSPLLLGNKLLAITMEKEFGDVKLSDKELDYGGSDIAVRLPDVHFFYGSTAASSDLCPNGFRAVVTARCDPTRSASPEARLPSGCPDGTCDGCLYHIILHTSQACPVCTANDYTVIRGECTNGKLTVHSIPSSLEYKYMKLVESKGASNGFELPVAESCGVEDGEDDEEVHDRVFFAKGKKRLFGGVGKHRREGEEKNENERRAFVALEETD